MNINTSCRVEWLPPTLQPTDRSWMPLNLAWNPKEPLLIRATFGAPKGNVEWLFSPELFTEGLLYPVGNGDVFLCPDPNDDLSVLLVLETDQRAGFRIPTKFLTDFLTRIEAARTTPAPWGRIR